MHIVGDTGRRYAVTRRYWRSGERHPIPIPNLLYTMYDRGERSFSRRVCTKVLTSLQRLLRVLLRHRGLHHTSNNTINLQPCGLHLHPMTRYQLHYMMRSFTAVYMVLGNRTVVETRAGKKRRSPIVNNEQPTSVELYS